MSFVAIASCDAQKSSNSTSISKTSIITDEKIENPYFGLVVKNNPSWYAMDEASLDKLLNVGGDIASYGSDDLKATIESTAPYNTVLFGIFAHAPGAPVDFNPNIIANA